MNERIKSLIITICGTVTCLAVIFFFVTFVLFLHNDVEYALKEALSISVSFSSVLATLGAAIIAASLFNDWTTTQFYTNALRASENLNETFMTFIQNYEKYIEILWLSRSKPEPYIVETIEYFNNFIKQKKNFDDAIWVSKLSFKEINFEELEIQLGKIESALKNAHPYNPTFQYSGYVDSIYLEENHNFNVLKRNLEDTYTNQVRQPMLNYLLKKALT